MLVASPFLQPGETSGTRGNKSTKRLTRVDSAVIYECFTLQCFVCSIIQKAIHVKAEKLPAESDYSKWVFVWFYKNNAENQSKIRYGIQTDLHILVGLDH